MKKRLFALIFVILIAIQCASAYVTISSTPKDKYNLGEAIPVLGYVSSEAGMSGFLRASIECGDSIFPSSLAPVSLNPGARLLFPSQIYVSPVIVSSSMSGICHLKVGLVESGFETDYALSKEFDVTKELKGSFRIQEKNIQIGSPVQITGIITRFDGKPVTGVAEIYNLFLGLRYMVAVVNMDNGNFSFIYPTKTIPAGPYTVEVLARDVYGNEQMFEAASYVISDKLTLTANIDKINYLPESQVMVTGTLRDVLGKPVSSATAYISMDGEETAAKISEGSLKYTFTLSKTIKTGRHTLSISASDEIGNSGAASMEIDVNPVATSVKVELLNAETAPLESIKAIPKLLDQAGDLINSEIDVSIEDAKGNLVFTGKQASGEKLNYTVQQYAVPGEWKINAKYNSLTADALFNVAELSELKIDVDGTKVLFTNTGNVKWKDDAEVAIKGEQGIFTRKMSKTLKPGETAEIEMGKQAPSGTYSLSVSTPDRTETFDNFAIPDGKKVYSLNIVYIVMLLLVVGLIAYELTLLLKKGGRMTPKLDHDDLRRLSRKAVSKVDAENAEARERQRMVDDYKRMTLDEIKKTEAKMQPQYPDRPWRRHVERKPAAPQKKDEGGAANFFGSF